MSQLHRIKNRSLLLFRHRSQQNLQGRAVRVQGKLRRIRWEVQLSRGLLRNGRRMRHLQLLLRGVQLQQRVPEVQRVEDPPGDSGPVGFDHRIGIPAAVPEAQISHKINAE